MGKASRRKHAAERQRRYFDIKDDARSDADRVKAKAMLDALQQKLDDDAQREDGFYFLDGKYVEARRPRFTPGMKTQTFTGHAQRITAVAVVPMESSVSTSPDLNSYVVTFGTDFIGVWNMKTGEQLGNVDVTSHCAVSICGAITRPAMSSSLWIGFATHLQPHFLLVDRNSFEFPSKAKPEEPLWNVGVGHQQQIRCMAFSTSPKPRLATGSLDSVCIIWDVAVDSVEPMLTIRTILPVADVGVSACVFTHDNQHVVTVGGDGVVKVWYVDTDEETNQLHQHRTDWHRATPFTLSLSQTREMLTFDDIAYSFHGNDEWLVHKHRECLHKTDVLKIPSCMRDQGTKSQANDPSKLGSTMETNSIFQFDREITAQLLIDETISDVETLRREYEKMDTFDFEKILNPATPVLIPSDSVENTHWPVLSPDAHGRLKRTFTKRKENGNYAAHTSHVSDCAVAEQVDLVVTVSFDKSVICWSFSSGFVRSITHDAHVAPITSCALMSPSSELELLLATSGKDNCVKVWRFSDLDQGLLECVYALTGHYDAITSLEFDVSGVFLVSAGDDTLAHSWRVRPAPPDAPHNLLVVKVDRFAITISWQAPLANGSALVKYIIHTEQLSTLTSDGRDMKPVPDKEVEVKYKTTTVDTLQPGIQYRLFVAAVNGVGQSRWSEPTEAVETLAFAPSKIDKAVLYREITATSVRLSWRPPRANGATITSYTAKSLPENTLFVPTMETSVPTSALTIATPEPQDHKRRHPVKSKTKKPIVKKVDNGPILYEYVLDGLWPGEVYQFVVAAENRCGIGEFSPFSDYVKMDSTAPDAPEKPHLTNIDKRQVDVTWSKPRSNGSEILQYIIEWTQAEEDSSARSSVTLLTKSIVGTTYTIGGLQPGRPLRVWLAATNLVHGKLTVSPFSEPSDVVYTISDVPDTPERPQIEVSTAHSIGVAILPPCDNGERIDRYRMTLFYEEIQFGIATKKIVQEIELEPHEFDSLDGSTSVLRHVLYKLRAKTFYSATVSAHNALGWSKISECSVALSTKPPAVPATIECPPEIREIEPTQAIIAWSQPIHDGGMPLASMVVQYSINQGLFDHEIVLFRGSELVLEQLKPQTTYAFRVAAINSVGRGEFSPPCPLFMTPSLVEYTITTYFACRPPIEHAKAIVLQRRYRLWKRRREEQRLFLEQLAYLLKTSWHLL